MVIEQKLRPGTRVRLVAPSPVLELRSDVGTVLRKDRWSGYYIIRLDQPAISLDTPSGQPEDVPEIREHVENLEILRGR